MIRTIVTILTWNKIDILKDTIKSLLYFNNKENFDLLILDNGSTDGTISYLNDNNFNYISKEKNVGIYLGCMELWQKAYDLKYDFILHLENDFLSINRTPILRLENYMDRNDDIGFIRLND